MGRPGKPKGLPKSGGRKVGTPNKATASVKAIAQAYTVEAVEILVGIARDGDAPPAARVSAVKELLDRGHGKAPQAITGPDGGDLALTVKKIVDVFVDTPPPAGAA